jgi:restriction system protein
MAIQSFYELINPLLLFLARQSAEVRIADACEAVADMVGLSEQDRQILIPSGGQAVYKHRIGWAHNRLKRAGYSMSPRRGYWMLTADGRQAVRNHPGGLPPDTITRLVNPSGEGSLPSGEDEEGAEAAATEVEIHGRQSPDERILDALREVEESVAWELLEVIKRSSPRFFENLVLDLLHGMGYGTSRADLQRVGGSGDGGIDGVISLDRLGLQKVYVQAKRWQSTVGSPEIRAFIGALQLQGADKGVFITASAFSRDAEDAAERARGSVVLIDGGRLAALMIEHGIGVTHKALRIPRVDSDYFDET